jgi:uncharacterized protein (DUF433 family)
MTAAKILGTGIYTIPEASRLIKIPSSTLRRWLQGYSFTFRGRRIPSPPKLKRQFVSTQLAMGFLDLIEARIVGKFRRSGVRWSTIGAAREAAKCRFDMDHPFASQRLRTDGQAVFVDVARSANDPAFENIVTNQKEFTPFLRPFLIDLVFDEESMASMWWPMGKEHGVVLDPTRSFGKPILNVYGVPTSVLADAVKAEGAAAPVARWFQVSKDAVMEAVRFQKSLAA